MVFASVGGVCGSGSEGGWSMQGQKGGCVAGQGMAGRGSAVIDSGAPGAMPARASTQPQQSREAAAHARAHLSQLL